MTSHLTASSQSDSDSASKSESQRPKFYHQYQSLNHHQQQQQPQAFKVQRSPDGKLNLVFNDPLVSLQTTQQRPPATSQPAPTTPPRVPTISDSKCKISIYYICDNTLEKYPVTNIILYSPWRMPNISYRVSRLHR